MLLHIAAFCGQATPKKARRQQGAELDALNRRFGKGTVKLASLVLPPGQLRAPWEGQAQWRTPQYSTRLEDFLMVG